jgi:hypothetical protein
VKAPQLASLEAGKGKFSRLDAEESGMSGKLSVTVVAALATLRSADRVAYIYCAEASFDVAAGGIA